MTSETPQKTKTTLQPPWGHFIALVVWLAIFGALYLFFDVLHKSKITVAATPGKISNSIAIPRSKDGHYYVSGSINGHPLTFLVDTGASTVSVTREFARRSGLPSGEPAQFETAGGFVNGEIIKEVKVEAAGIEVSGINIGVGMLTSDQSVGLLGQNFLRQVELRQSGDEMILRIKKP